MGETSFARLDNGDWGVRTTNLDAKEGDQITVERKDGSTSTVTLQTLVLSDEEHNLWAVIGDKKSGAKAAPKGGRSEASDKRMNRASAQKQACQIVRALGYVPDETTFRGLIQWFENDIYGKKAGVEIWPNTSETPADQEGLPI